MEKNFISVFQLGMCQLLGGLEAPQDVPLDSGVTRSQLRHQRLRDSGVRMCSRV